MKGLGQGAAKKLAPSHLERIRRREENRADVVLNTEGRPLTKTERMDLGLAILSCLGIYGEPLTCDDQAAWCGCTHAGVNKIEAQALDHLRALVADGDPRMAELFDLLFPREREAAKPHRTRTYL